MFSFPTLLQTIPLVGDITYTELADTAITLPLGIYISVIYSAHTTLIGSGAYKDA